MSKQNHDYKADGLGVFAQGDSDSHYKVAASLYDRGYGPDWVAKSCGITPAKSQEYYVRWKAAKK